MKKTIKNNAGCKKRQTPIFALPRSVTLLVISGHGIGHSNKWPQCDDHISIKGWVTYVRRILLKLSLQFQHVLTIRHHSNVFL